MTETSLQTHFATLDVANTHRQLQLSFLKTPSLNRLLVDIFHDASAASAESASRFLQHNIQTSTDAQRIANIIKSFAGAVPRRNIPPFVQLCAFLAISSFSTSTCAAPLETFSFTESSTKRQAISAVISRLIQISRSVSPSSSSSISISDALDRIYPFFEHLISDPDSSIRRDAIHALISLPSSSIPPVHVSAFLSRLPASPSPFSSDISDDDIANVDTDSSFESFLTLAITRGASSTPRTSKTKPSSSSSSIAPVFRNVLIRALLRAVDFGTAGTLFELHAAHTTEFVAAVSEISLDVFLFVITSLAATLACSGKLSACVQALAVASDVANDARLRHVTLHRTVAAAVRVISTCIASLAAVASADELSLLSSSLFRRVDYDGNNGGEKKTMEMPSLSNTPSSRKDRIRDRVISEESLVESCDELVTAAVDADCPAALSVVLMLRGLVSRWAMPSATSKLVRWLVKDVVHMMIGSKCFSLRTNGEGKGRESGSILNMLRDDEDYLYPNALGYQNDLSALNADNDIATVDRTIVSMCTAVTTLVALHHPHPHVRLHAANVFSRFPDTPVLLFCLPAAMICLSVETHPAIAIRLLQDVIPCEALVNCRETAGIVLTSVTSVMKSVASQQANSIPTSTATELTSKTSAAVSAVLQTGIVGVAKAAKYAPGRVTKILVMEIEKLRARFEHTSADERIAGAAGILTLVKERPARGSKFVPFITLCIQKESVTIAPEAASMCIDAMLVMCEEEVMDGAKTVKIVMKKSPDLLQMNSMVLHSFLKLVRCAAMDMKSKKGKAIAEIVIDLLRKSVTVWAGAVEGEEKNASLEWNHVGEAAESLAMFSVNDILRIAYSHEDPSIDLEAERARLEKIEENCGQFVASVLETARQAEGDFTRFALQKLLNKIAKHEWDERPRGNFDPERIVKLRSTSKALQRARKRAATAAAARTGKIVGKNGKVVETAEKKEDDEEESVRQQFAHAVEGMPVGAIRTLCTESAILNSFAVRACAEGGAVTSALPWIGLVEEWFSGAVNSCDRKDDDEDDAICAACLRVLRFGYSDGNDKIDMKRLRKRWFTPESLSGCGEKQGVELFLGITMLDDDWMLSQAMQFVQNPEMVYSFIVTAVGSMRKRLESEKRIKAVRALICMVEEREKKGEYWSVEELGKIEEALCIHAKEEVMDLVWTSQLSKTRVRLICRIGEKGAVRTVATDVISGKNRDLREDMDLLRVVGIGVGKLRTEVRRGLICKMAERPSIAAGVVVCHGLGATAWLPGLGKALIAGLTLCDIGERVAVRKLADFAIGNDE